MSDQSAAPGMTQSAWARCRSAVLNFFFYLICGGEKRFRARCASFVRPSNGDRVLDLCCGAGALTALLARCTGAGGWVLGVDICRDELESARMAARGVPADFAMAGVECLPLASSTFTKCCISLGMHHLAEPSRRDALREILRVLMPGGSLFVIDYNLPDGGPAKFAAMAITTMDSSAEARTMLCQHSLVGEVQKAGFQISRREFFCCGTMQLIEATKLT